MVGDYLKESVADYLNSVAGLSFTIEAADTNVKKGKEAGWVEVGEGTEEEGLDGVYEIDGEVVLKMWGKDETEEARREMMEAVKDALGATDPADDGLPVQDRRLAFVVYVEAESDDLKVFDIREVSGEWDEDEGKWEGRLPFTVVCCEEVS